MADVSKYLALITSEHQGSPKFMAFVEALTRPFADIAAQLAALPGLYDLDAAVGAQLDVVGQWVGASRNLLEPLPNVYFSWGVDELGWGQGSWFGPYDPVSGLVALPDDAYRTLLRARIAANHWDGTVPSAYAIWNQLFSSLGYRLLIQDNQDMTMLVAVTDNVPDAVTLALLTNGYLDLRPAGVRVTGYVMPSTPGTPLFGWGLETIDVAGWGHGSWPTELANTSGSVPTHSALSRGPIRKIGG